MGFRHEFITSALPQITKRDRTLPKLHNTLHHSTSPLHYPSLRNMTKPYHSQTTPHITPQHLCYTIRYETIVTTPLLYNMLLYCTEHLYFSVTIDNIAEHNLCYTYNKAHYTTIPLLYDTLPCITVA